LEESDGASALAIGRHKWFPTGSSASEKATKRRMESVLIPVRSLARPKARQEDHYEPFGSIDASTFLYRLAVGTDQFFDC